MLALMVAAVVSVRRRRRGGRWSGGRRGGGMGPGASGAIYELLNGDTRRAVAIPVAAR